MKTTALRVVSLVLILAFAVSLSACGDLFSTTDYPTVDKLEQSLGVNGDPVGKTVKVTVEKTIPNAAQGYIVQQGKFNFCLPSDPAVTPGKTITIKITSVTRQTDAIYVYGTKV
jgi:predicted RNA-binding protein with TRAM domain